MKRFVMASAGMLIMLSFAACGNNKAGTDTTDTSETTGYAVCGNGACETGETNANCPSDCPATNPVCGNGACETGETNANCPSDCKVNGPVCGNGACETGETASNCPADCSEDVLPNSDNGGSGPVCGDGKCDSSAGETTVNCPSDCKGNDVIVNPDNGNDVTGPVCGNNKCETGETAANCPSDCAATTLDCKGYADCAYGCNQDQACITNCQNQSTPAAVSDYGSMSTCLQKNCTGLKGDQFSQCVNDNCLDEYFKCFSGNTYQKCTDLVGCLNNCPKDDPKTPNVNEAQKCAGDCWSNSTYDTEWDLQHLIDCANDQCTTECTDPKSTACNTCFNNAISGTECKQYADKCFAHGTDTCGQIYNCLTGCSTGDQACINTCFGNGTSAAQKQFNDWQQCASDACKSECADTSSKACNDCWQAAVNSGGSCNNLFQACIDDIPNGDQLCGQIMGCMNGCAKGDKACSNACYYNGTSAAQKQYSDWQQCGLDACKSECVDQQSDACNTCWVAAVNTGGSCYSQVQACIDDIPNGDQHCNESWGCLTGATTTAQANQCKYDATKDAQGMMNDILDCANNACKSDCSSDPTSKACTDCFNAALTPGTGACKDKIATCQNDKNPS